MFISLTNIWGVFRTDHFRHGFQALSQRLREKVHNKILASEVCMVPTPDEAPQNHIGNGGLGFNPKQASLSSPISMSLSINYHLQSL
ncbi:hypothetical protein V6N13_105916 [Hibiscus sabdariffa]